ncbi:hypothetical protein ACIOHC_35680 [Streptomyces sp. NPDC088252]|uniref:hypothetical protein n=1 Tax=Streptomyces sp. NPDC088252 TaxID=3365845 RepID=UPI0037F47CB1
MSNEDNERRFHELVRQSGWANEAEDLRPEAIRIPGGLVPWTIEGEVEDPNDLYLWTYEGETPEFADGEGGVQASEVEIARWRADFDKYKRAETEYVEMVRAAKVEYEKQAEAAQRFLAAAFAEFKPTQEEQLARMGELAVTLAGHRKAAEEWAEAREAKRQAVLDAQFGPRSLVLYPPGDLDDRKQSGHIARVHLVGCSRRRGAGDDPVRAKDAVERLRDPATWPRSGREDRTHGGRYQMVVKLCSFCKPWKVMMEHTDVTAQIFRTDIKLVEWPAGLE